MSQLKVLEQLPVVETELRWTGALVMELAPADYLMACVKDTYDFLLSVATIYHTD